MALQADCFTPFKESISSHALPKYFTFPFHYQPHPLCLIAAKELQDYLQSQNKWVHNFGLVGDKQDYAIGKMFGVLIVQNKQHEIGYLSAFSGKVANTNHLPNFVPPVFDMLSKESFFLKDQLEITQLSSQIKQLETAPELEVFKGILNAELSSSILKIKVHRQLMIDSRKIRKSERLAAETTLNTKDFLSLKKQLGQQSINEKNQLRDLTIYWDERVKKAQENYHSLSDKIDYLKSQRKKLSTVLQKNIFQQYRFLNTHNTEKSLYTIFKETSLNTPPAGAGECAAPKLLQYAFLHDLKPLAMAEFWWGKPPKSAVKKHKNFYPACQGKCQPILEHMLKGITLDENPLLNNPAKEKSIDIIYEDDVMLVINKPTGLLSIPGKTIEDSVYFRIKQSYPRASGPLTIHRLDMSTSGLMLIALTKDAHKILQKQFIKRTIKKRYVALLEGLLKEDNGTIKLPLRLDIDDRPHQLVCFEHGKPATTKWQIIERKNNQTKVFFSPITGRTHQLRVHSAHKSGLNTPIVGDNLYGNKANRLHLHAESIEFTHPISRELMRFSVDADF